MKPRIYIAGPITKGNQFHNCANGIKAASEVYKLGAIPFCPHLTALWDFVDQSMTYEDWMTICFEWIPQCHAVLRISGESVGADREVELAKSLGMPVFYSLAELKEALPNLRDRPQYRHMREQPRNAAYTQPSDDGRTMVDFWVDGTAVGVELL